MNAHLRPGRRRRRSRRCSRSCPCLRRTLLTTTDGSSPALSTIWRSGSSRARSTISMPASWSWLSPFRPLSVGARAQQRHTAAGDDAFLDRRAGRVQRVLDAGLLLLHLDLGRGADLDHRHAAGQLRQPLLQLLLVVVATSCPRSACGCSSTRASIAAFSPAPSMIVVSSLSTSTFFARPRSSSVDVLELEPEVLGDHRAAGQDRDVLEHRLAAVAEARRLDGGDLQDAAQLVDDQRGQRLALDVLGDDQQRLAGLGDLLEQRAAGRGCCEIFFSWIRMYGIFEHARPCLSGLVTKYGER